jgi:hypothetical protein
VIVVGRSFRDADTPGLQFVEADLSTMAEAQRVAKALPAEGLDLLIFTTGIFASPKRQETAEGIERDLAVSYLNRFVCCASLRRGSARTDKIPRVSPGCSSWHTPARVRSTRCCF